MQMLFPNAPRSIKFASGENPKRVYGRRNEVPSTRMGNFEVMRQSFEDAKAYMAELGRIQRQGCQGATKMPSRPSAT